MSDGVQKADSDAIVGIAAVLGWLARAKADDAALRRLQALLVSAVVAVPALQFFEIGRGRKMGGRGRIFSYVVYHRVYHPAFAQEVPYAVAVIELDEGPRMISNVIGIAPDKLVCDMKVEVAYEPITEAITLPKFKPAAA